MNNSWDWSKLAFGSKKPIKDLKATFIAAPREISAARFSELVKEYLPKGNIVLGLAKEQYVLGFDGQPQFRTLQVDVVRSIIDAVNASGLQYKIHTLDYTQRDLPFILEKIPFARAVFVNGSWQYTFHSSPSYYILTASSTPYELVSAFTDEREARSYEERVDTEIIARLDDTGAGRHQNNPCSAEELLHIATLSATRSYDHSFQTGLTLGKAIVGKRDQYTFLISTYNRVVPYQTYAMLHGASREANFSPPNDLNHYDTIHAEVELLVQAQKAHEDLSGTTVFINLMPCPACARMFTRTDIAEFVYSIDHSDGYAVKMLQAAGKKVRRMV